ncbi:MAG: response regulator [Chitinophagaceae bacterium]|nr:MAG: response regulator [Chitinophagaceae bacterium]
MSRSGPILVIEDDEDDREIVESIFRELNVPNERVYCANSPDAVAWLLKAETPPFLILSDMNLPGMNGAQLKQLVNGVEALRKKAIPFIFLTTTAERTAVEEAYEEMSQGFFEKPTTMDGFRDLLRMIVAYWKACKHPNSGWA